MLCKGLSKRVIKLVLQIVLQIVLKSYSSFALQVVLKKNAMVLNRKTIYCSARGGIKINGMECNEMEWDGIKRMGWDKKNKYFWSARGNIAYKR